MNGSPINVYATGACTMPARRLDVLNEQTVTGDADQVYRNSATEALAEHGIEAAGGDIILSGGAELLAVNDDCGVGHGQPLVETESFWQGVAPLLPGRHNHNPHQELRGLFLLAGQPLFSRPCSQL